MSEFWTCEYGANHGSGEACDCVPGELPVLDKDALIVVEQLPVIRERLQALGDEIDRRIDRALSLACTEETLKSVRTERAQLNKDFGAMEERRAGVKTSIMAPYEQFNAVYKEFVSDKYKSADATLKARITEVEGAIKLRKEKCVKAYFEEYAASRHLDGYYINWELTGITVTLSASEKSLKAQAKEYVDTQCKNLESIAKREHAAEILVEYRQSLSVMDAIEAVERRHRLLAEQAEQQVKLEAAKAADAEVVKRVDAVAPLAPPTVKPVENDSPVRTLKFRVLSPISAPVTITAPMAILREFKKCLVDGGYEFE